MISIFARELIDKYKKEWKPEDRLAGRLDENLANWLEGWLEGWIQGRMEGSLEGRAELIFELLKDRFGSVPDWARSKVEKANQEAMKSWTTKIYGAEKIEQIFQ